MNIIYFLVHVSNLPYAIPSDLCCECAVRSALEPVVDGLNLDSETIVVVVVAAAAIDWY